jgi:hypothetical protein
MLFETVCSRAPLRCLFSHIFGMLISFQGFSWNTRSQHFYKLHNSGKNVFHCSQVLQLVLQQKQTHSGSPTMSAVSHYETPFSIGEINSFNQRSHCDQTGLDHTVPLSLSVLQNTFRLKHLVHFLLLKLQQK